MSEHQIMFAVISKKAPNKIHSLHLSKWHAQDRVTKASTVVRVAVVFDQETKIVTVRGHEYQKEVLKG